MQFRLNQLLAELPQLGEYLISRKHVKIGGIFKSDDAQGPERYFGLISAMIDAGLNIDDKHFCWYDTDDRAEIVGEGGYSLLDRFIDKRLKDCTAIVCYNDEIAYNLIKQAARKRRGCSQRESCCQLR